MKCLVVAVLFTLTCGSRFISSQLAVGGIEHLSRQVMSAGMTSVQHRMIQHVSFDVSG